MRGGKDRGPIFNVGTIEELFVCSKVDWLAMWLSLCLVGVVRSISSSSCLTSFSPKVEEQKSFELHVLFLISLLVNPRSTDMSTD